MSICPPIYLGPALAGCTVLWQVEAQHRQFAVWHQDHIVKRLSIKGLAGQEMALEEYLQYIQQEALAALRRNPARASRKVRQPSLWGQGASCSPSLASFLKCVLHQ